MRYRKLIAPLLPKCHHTQSNIITNHYLHFMSFNLNVLFLLLLLPFSQSYLSCLTVHTTSRMENTEGEPKEKASPRIVCTLCWAPIFVIVICILAWRPILLPQSLKFMKITLSHIINDNQRFLDNEWQFAQQEWRFYQMERRFGQDWCKENTASRSDVTWLTVTINEEFVIPTLVLGHSIRTFSCQKNMIVFISEAVSETARKALQSVGWDTRLVEEMDCNWMDARVGGDRNSGFFGRPLGHRIKGTHTRFHAWNYTEFSKIIYVDADYMLMTNIDELFNITEDFAAAPCSRPGVLDPCFNAGLLVFRPDSRFYQGIMKLWRKTTEKDTCPTDHDTLTEYFTDAGNWKKLAYTYNIRRTIFRPMKSFHFACCRTPKPWTAACRPSRKEAMNFNGPILSLDHMALVFWKNFYELLGKYKLEDWWSSTKFYKPTQEFGMVSYGYCQEQLGTSNRTTLKEILMKHVNRTKSNLLEGISSILNRTFSGRT